VAGEGEKKMRGGTRMPTARRLKQSSLRGMIRVVAVKKQMEAAKELCRCG